MRTSALSRLGARRCAALLLLLAVGLGLIAGCAEEIAEDTTRYEIDLSDSPARGASRPSVVLVEFIDIQCPYCATALRRSTDLLERYPDDLQLVFKHFPVPAIHTRAMPAAIAVECARAQGRFWEMLDRLVASEASLSEDALVEHAEALDLDMAAFHVCQASQPPLDRILRDQAQGVALHVQATPTSFLNGRRIVGLPSTQRLIELIEQEMARQPEQASDDR
ncbi:MAG: DsbA family protein [Myxococcales bacterium]|jgi:protein-disulfide isomerase|nr:DsbA family protein [Myxococcales bacterium]